MHVQVFTCIKSNRIVANIIQRTFLLEAFENKLLTYFPMPLEKFDVVLPTTTKLES
jgi:hypothetical protein